MPIGFLKKIFRPETKAPKPDAEKTNEPVERTQISGEADPVKFVEFIVANLVSQPEAVKIESSSDDENSLAILISCDKNDMGRVIGKRGRTISAIRSLAIDAANRGGIRNLKVELQD